MPGDKDTTALTATLNSHDFSPHYRYYLRF